MRARASLAIGIAALSLAGCGGPSKAEYIAEVDGICQRTRPASEDLAREFARVNREFARVRTAGGRAKLARLVTALDSLGEALDKQVATHDRFVKDVKAVERPGGEAGEGADRFIRSAEQDVAVLRRLDAAVKSKNLANIQRATQPVRARRTTTQRIARQYGFKACGRG